MGRNPLPRRPHWSKAFVISEMRSGKSMAQICKENTLDYKWIVLRDEIDNWRASDPEFRQDYDEILDHQYPNRANAGRSKKEELPEYADWKREFCENLFETGSRLKAAELSPYKYDAIAKKMDPRSNQYDKEFADMVHEIEIRMIAEFEGGFIEAFRDSKLGPKDKAWVAKSWLERRAPERWGKQVEMIHSGKITHEIKKESKSREELLSELIADQKRFIENNRKSLPESRENVIDVTVINESAKV